MNLINSKNADIFLIFVAISWGSTFVLVQNAIKDIPVFSFLYIRFFLAFLIMFILFFKKLDFDTTTIKYATLLGLFNFLAYSTQTFALNYTSSAVVGFITGLNVVFVPIIAYFFFKKHLSVYSIIAVVLSAVGVYFLTNSAELSMGYGEFLTMLCAIFVALHINLTDKFVKSRNIFTLVTFQFLAIAIFSFLLSFFEESREFEFSSNVILAIVVTTLFATVFAFLVQTYAQKFTSATQTAIIFTLEPFVAALFGYLNNEPLGLSQLIGFILIISAMLISELKEKLFSFLLNKFR